MGDSQKKCPNCGQWSSWDRNYDDRCDHCGEYLAQEEKRRETVKEEEKLRQEKDWMFRVDPTDNAWIKFWKKAGNLFYVVFMAIMSFIMWVIAALPG
ncbi:hypothetical protein [Algoriphagus namhaensis]